MNNNSTKVIVVVYTFSLYTTYTCKESEIISIRSYHI